MQKVIAIDGPCGSGKSSIAKQLSTHFGITHIDTGAMYRAIGYIFQKEGFDIENLSEQSKRLINTDTTQSTDAKAFLTNLQLKYVSKPNFYISVNDIDVTKLIRVPEISKLASVISQYQFIRFFLTTFQRELVTSEVCIMEGRDIGTVVFKNAICKIYLTATEEERAKRRLVQYKLKNVNLDLKNVIEEVKLRDHSDMTREIAPLKQAEDAILIDSTNLTEQEVIAKIAIIVKEKFQKTGIDL